MEKKLTLKNPLLNEGDKEISTEESSISPPRTPAVDPRSRTSTDDSSEPIPAVDPRSRTSTDDSSEPIPEVDPRSKTSTDDSSESTPAVVPRSRTSTDDSSEPTPAVDPRPLISSKRNVITLENPTNGDVSPPYNPAPYNAPYPTNGDVSPPYNPVPYNAPYPINGDVSPPYNPTNGNKSPKEKANVGLEKTDKLIIPKKNAKNQNRKILEIYSRSLVSKKVSLEMKHIGSNIISILEKNLKDSYEGKCIAEGYVKKNSIKIISYSSGKINNFGVLYEVSFECYICFPVEGQLINCVATNITKAGIKGASTESPSPFIVFISRDHLLPNKKFSDINEKDHFVARIIGQRFELNDTYISIIAEIKETKERKRY